MATNQPLTDLSKEDLIEMINDLKKQKKYGLIWEDQPEDVEEMMKTHLPVLEEREELKLLKDDLKPHHLLLEGDNLHSLKVLEKTHKEAVDVIYIDPPYNTGNKDFMYNDHFVDKEDAWRHSSWLSFMDKRLKIARKLLSDNGVIFISIDDNEMAQLRLLCDGIFGEKNVEVLIWHTNDPSEGGMPKTASLTVRKEHEYIICAYKTQGKRFNRYMDQVYLNSVSGSFTNPDNDPRGDWMSGNISRGSIKSTTGSKYFTITNPNGGKYARNWKISEEEYKKLRDDNRMWFGLNGNGVPRIKVFKEEPKAVTQSSIVSGVKTSYTGRTDLEEMGITFSYPKPTQLIKRLLTIGNDKNAIVLDFFAGSGTTGHAVLELNEHDGGNRQFILCTNNEVSVEKEQTLLINERLLRDKPKSKVSKAYKEWVQDLHALRQTNLYKEFTELEAFQQHGISRAVTYIRLQSLINGYTTPKGQQVEGISSNLHYYTTAFIDKRELSFDNQELVERLDTFIAMKENTYDSTDLDGIRVLSSLDKQVFIYPNDFIAQEDAKTISEHMSDDKDTIIYIQKENKVDKYINALDATIKFVPTDFFKGGELRVN